MNNLFKGATAMAVALGTGSYTALAASSASNFFGQDKSNGKLEGADGTADQAIQNIIGNFTTFLYLVAVMFALWGGFQILTAGGDDGKVSKGKTILIQAGLGLVVIFLASSIIEWLVTLVIG